MKSGTGWILGAIAIAAGLWWLSKQNQATTTLAPTQLPPSGGSTTPPAPAPVTIDTSGMMPINYGGDLTGMTDILNGSLATEFMGAGLTNPSLEVTTILGNPLVSGS